MIYAKYLWFTPVSVISFFVLRSTHFVPWGRSPCHPFELELEIMQTSKQNRRCAIYSCTAGVALAAFASAASAAGPNLVVNPDFEPATGVPSQILK